MSVVSKGFGGYQLWNMFNEGSNADEMAQIFVSPSSSANLINAVSGDGSLAVTLRGNFTQVGSNLADVKGSITEINVTQNGAPWFTDQYGSGADWQGLISNFDYALSLLSGNDSFTASLTQRVNDKIQGMAGNDVFAGYGDEAGNNNSVGDEFYGGDGIDTAIYRGPLSQYSIQDSFISDTRDQSYEMVPAKLVTDFVGNRDGFDKLVDVERLQFADTNVAFDTDVWDNAGSAYRLYTAAFDREPDEVGLGYWIEQLDNGASLQLAASGFIHSAEFESLYGANASDTTFVTKLYNNVLDRNPDQGGLDYWLYQLDNGMSRESALINFSESGENVQNVAPLIVNGIHYQDWLG
jgi:Domain of unknown function (DUF4214)